MGPTHSLARPVRGDRRPSQGSGWEGGGGERRKQIGEFVSQDSRSILSITRSRATAAREVPFPLRFRRTPDGNGALSGPVRGIRATAKFSDGAGRPPTNPELWATYPAGTPARPRPSRSRAPQDTVIGACAAISCPISK